MSQHDEMGKTIELMKREIMSIPGARDELTERDIREALIPTQPEIDLNLPFDKISDEQFKGFLNKRLLTNRAYHVYFPLHGKLPFPEGYALGHGRLLALDSLSAEVREFLTELWYRGSETSGHDFTFLNITVEACGQDRAVQKAKELADESVNLLRVIYRRKISLRDCIYALSGQYPVGGSREIETGPDYYYDNTIEQASRRLTEILTVQNPTDLEKRLRNAVRICALGIEAGRHEIRHTMLAAGLESLLMTEGDRGKLGYKLAEKVAFLLEESGQRRAEVFQQVKGLYARRSDFVHQKPGRPAITTEDVRELDNVFTRVFGRLLELRSLGYTQIEKVDGSRTIDGLVDELKFG